MSDKKEPRALEAISQEYQQLCYKVGQNQYQIYVLKKDIEMMNEQIRNLNFEAAASQKAAAEKKVAETAAVSTPDNVTPA